MRSKERKQKYAKVDEIIKPIEVKEDNIFENLELKKLAKNRDKDISQLVNPELLNLENVTLEKYNKLTFKRGLDSDEKPFPQQPRIGPYEIKEPIQGAKNYFWCSCGMSRTQPFCDSSHMGSKFKPLKFSIEQMSSDNIFLCGWKLSSTAPFCDGKTCEQIKGNWQNEGQAEAARITDNIKEDTNKAEL